MSIRSLGDIVARAPPCVCIPEDASAFNLADTLVQHKVDAVAVLSSADNSLIGIATTRDVAKCLARGENMPDITVSQFMTVRPVTLPPSETPATALALMREGSFRHIPIVRQTDSALLGIVDVLNLACDAIARLQVSYSMIPSRRAFDFMRAARDKIEKPTLRPILDRSPVATLTKDHTVADACQIFIRHNLAAVVIVDANNVLDGIFTCRDVASRVVSKRLNPHQTKLEHVMTLNPDCAAPSYTVLESLQRMHACAFRHLPVVDNHSRELLGLVDVLELASHTLLGLQTAADTMDASNAISKPEATLSNRQGRQRSMLPTIFSGLFSSYYAEPESAQHVPLRPPLHRPTTRKQTHLSSLQPRRNLTSPDVPLASFKFKDINGEYRRIKVPMIVAPGVFDKFVFDVRRRFTSPLHDGGIKIKYIDEDKDEVVISNDEDLAGCFEDHMESRDKTIFLRVYEIVHTSNSHSQSPVSSNPSSTPGSPRRRLNSVRSEASAPADAYNVPRDGLPQPQEVTVTMKRRTSQMSIKTPSQQKTAMAHRKMLDGKHEEAISLYEEALKLNPNNARAQGGRAAARLFNGNSVGGEEDYRSAIQMIEEGRGGTVGDLTYQMCVVGLVESLIDQRRYEEAAAVAARIKSDCGNTGCIDAFRDELDSASNAAREALDDNEFPDAMNCYTNAIRVENGYLKLVPTETFRASLRLGRAKCYKALEDFDMALEDYEAAVEIEPESVAGHKGCGKCLTELEQLDRALEAYQTAQKLDHADEEVRKEIEAIKRILPNPMESKRAEIAKLGALLNSLKLPEIR